MNTSTVNPFYWYYCYLLAVVELEEEKLSQVKPVTDQRARQRKALKFEK